MRHLGVCLLALALCAACGQGSPLSLPSNVERGESGAVNPARHVTVACTEKDKTGDVTVTITNNCDKSSHVEGAPVAE